MMRGLKQKLPQPWAYRVGWISLGIAGTLVVGSLLVILSFCF